MEIVITNTKVRIQSLPLITKGNQSLDSLTGASITGSAEYNYIWVLDACTGLSRVTGINYVPCYYDTSEQKTTRFYKINKSTLETTLIAEYTPQDSELNIPKHLDVDVELGENEYMGISGAMYYAMSGSDSFRYRFDTEQISDNQVTNLWYNIEGFV